MVRFFAIKADGKKCRPLSVNFNLTSLSRARALSGLPAIALCHVQQHVYNISQQLGGVGV